MVKASGFSLRLSKQVVIKAVSIKYNESYHSIGLSTYYFFILKKINL